MTARRVERLRQQQARANAGIEMPLVHVSPNQIAGLIEALAAPPYDGKADLPDIAYEQELEVDELFPVAEAMQLLRLADVEGGDIKLTHMGKRFADAELNERKEIFSRALMSHVPLAGAYPPGAGRTRQPFRAQDAASWTSWKTIWPRTRRKRR